MTVYFVRAGDVGAIKIGFTADEAPAKRLSELQVGCPLQLKLLGSIPGTRKHEKFLHDQLFEHRLIGEWFDPVEAVLGEVERALSEGFQWPTLLLPRHVAQVSHDRISDEVFLAGKALAIEAAGSILKLSKFLGVTRSAVSQWPRIPSKRAVKIIRELGIPGHLMRPDIWPVPSHAEAA